MPVYEYHCDKCDREVTLTLTIREHEKGEIKCPKCGGKSLRPLLTSSFVTASWPGPAARNDEHLRGGRR
jgi:putative FmdB family regulatory protein